MADPPLAAIRRVTDDEERNVMRLAARGGPKSVMAEVRGVRSLVEAEGLIDAVRGKVAAAVSGVEARCDCGVAFRPRPGDRGRCAACREVGGQVGVARRRPAGEGPRPLSVVLDEFVVDGNAPSRPVRPRRKRRVEHAQASEWGGRMRGAAGAPERASRATPPSGASAADSGFDARDVRPAREEAGVARAAQQEMVAARRAKLRELLSERGEGTLSELAKLTGSYSELVRSDLSAVGAIATDRTVVVRNANGAGARARVWVLPGAPRNGHRPDASEERVAGMADAERAAVREGPRVVSGEEAERMVREQDGGVRVGPVGEGEAFGGAEPGIGPLRFDDFPYQLADVAAAEAAEAAAPRAALVGEEPDGEPNEPDERGPRLEGGGWTEEPESTDAVPLPVGGELPAEDERAGAERPPAAEGEGQAVSVLAGDQGPVVRRLVTELARSELVPPTDGQGGAYWALDALETFEGLVEKGWRFVPPAS